MWLTPTKRKKVAELKRKLKDVDALYLATDGDREGEAIAWHLKEVLKPKVPVYRMTFPEITREAIERAFGELRDIDLHLVDAQETRRILDRIYGYEISPVLWRKVGRGLSAGRVQSVATRLVVERERERMAFVAANYWDLTGHFITTSSEGFDAKLVAVDGTRVATGKDFADDGTLTSTKVTHLSEADARTLAEALTTAPFSVRSVETKPYKRRPAAPFTTSTLQQEAARKLRFSSRVTMQVAQRLYESGYITYMRTDLGGTLRPGRESGTPSSIRTLRHRIRALRAAHLRLQEQKTRRKRTKQSAPQATRSAPPTPCAARSPTTNTGCTS